MFFPLQCWTWRKVLSASQGTFGSWSKVPTNPPLANKAPGPEKQRFLQREMAFARLDQPPFRTRTNELMAGGLLAAGLIGLLVMQAWRARGDGQAGRHAASRRSGAMPALLRRKNDDAELCPDQR